MVRAVFAGFAGVVPKFDNVVVDDKIGGHTQYFVLPILNVKRKIMITDFPQCQVVSLADFEKVVNPCYAVQNILSVQEWEVLSLAEFDLQDNCWDCVLMQFQFADVYEKVDAAFFSSKKPCRHLQALYHKVNTIFRAYADNL